MRAVQMQSVQLTPALTTTRIGFGCAGLMREASGARRQRVLAAAFEQGIRHFDVARMYGLGAAEGELGRFARGRRESMIIATKFGIQPASASGRLARFQGPARMLLARYPGLRDRVKRRSDTFRQVGRYDAATARASLEQSLRELGTDHVDLLMLHGPTAGDAIDVEEISEFLEGARQAGSIRAWGLAGEQDSCLELARALPVSTVLQIRDDIFSRTAALGAGSTPRPPITFGVLASALARIRAHLAAAPERRARWSERIGVDCASAEALAALLLRDALAANREGVVLLATGRPERLQGIAAAAEVRDDDATLAAFRRQIEDELLCGSVAG
jgi:D-threo-aldose 1-dehydrogenase